MKITAVLSLALFCAMAGVTPAQTPPAPASPPALNANFNGRWVGVLEYRDYSSNAQVFLPTWLTLTPAPDGHTITLSYVYDDGPTKTVRETSTLTLSPETAKATFNGGNDKSPTTYDVLGFAEFAKTGRGVLLLSGKGVENQKPVDVRIILTMKRNLYTYRKETRLEGDEFKFRDAYTFTRAESPSL